MSEKMDEWLRKLSQRHKKIVEELEGERQLQNPKYISLNFLFAITLKYLFIANRPANIAYASENLFEEKIETNEEYDPDQGERILSKYITEDLVNNLF